MGIFGNTFTGWHFLVVALVVLLLFGATKLPALAKSVGQSMKIFRSEIKSDDKRADAQASSDAAAQATPVPAASADATTPPATRSSSNTPTS
jgi:sec-independent protein translocase protein TatA